MKGGRAMTRKIFLLVLAAVSFSGIASVALADDSRWQSANDPIKRIINQRSEMMKKLNASKGISTSTVNEIYQRRKNEAPIETLGTAGNRTTISKVQPKSPEQPRYIAQPAPATVTPYQTLGVIPTVPIASTNAPSVTAQDTPKKRVMGKPSVQLASRAATPLPAMATVPKDTPHKRVVSENKTLQMHDADHEVYAFAGLHFNNAARGGWLSAKNTKWWGFKDYPVNLGGGLSFDASAGKTYSGYGWGYVEPGVNVGAYVFGEEDDFLTRLNLAYRVPLHQNNTSGFVPGIELQYTHGFSNRLALIANTNWKYFRNDSHGGAGLVLEYLFTPDFRVKAGIVADIGIGGDATKIGVGPTISFDFYNRYVIGANFLVFGPNGVTYGPFIGWKYTKYLNEYLAKDRDKAVTKKSNGEISNPMPAVEDIKDIKLRDNGNGTYSTLAWDTKDDGTPDETLGEYLNKKQGDGKGDVQGGIK